MVNKQQQRVAKVSAEIRGIQKIVIATAENSSAILNGLKFSFRLKRLCICYVSCARSFAVVLGSCIVCCGCVFICRLSIASAPIFTYICMYLYSYIDLLHYFPLALTQFPKSCYNCHTFAHNSWFHIFRNQSLDSVKICKALHLLVLAKGEVRSGLY